MNTTKKVSQILILIFILNILLSGCSSGLYNLNSFILPNDAEFLALIEELDTPRKISDYMIENFTYEPHLFYILTPYELYLIKKGDCDEFSNCFVYISNHHKYETYQIKIFYKATIHYHVIAIFKENNKYNFSDNQHYFFVEAINFKEIVKYDSSLHKDKIWIKYKVYDYNMNLIETNYAS